VVRKVYEWEKGAILGEHSRKKHAILKEYFRQYLLTRCQYPRQERFRMVVIDGFTGSGLYGDGSFGSPIIFVEVLLNTANEINLCRANQGIKPIHLDCLLILNDDDRDLIEQLKQNLAPHLIKAEQEARELSLTVEYHASPFESVYPEIKQRLLQTKTNNVLFNLDQYSYAQVSTRIIRDIMHSWKNAEVILTFMIGSLLAFLSPDKEKSGVPLESGLQEKVDAILDDENLLSKKEWLGVAEKIVHTYLRECAPHVSPFSINNPNGWRYWLMHFANSYRARQVYNNVLHEDSETQAHFGRAGLNMLSYDPSNNFAQLYLFDNDSRKAAIEALQDDIPRLVGQSGDTLPMAEFYAMAYSETPAHSEDIHHVIIDNPDLEVITINGGSRKKADQITSTDTLKLKMQKNFFFTFK
jgi:three-Cys-motif partner protein